MTVSASLRGTRRPVILQESRAPQAPDVTCGTRTAVHGWGWPDPDALGPLTDCPLAGVGLRMIVEVSRRCPVSLDLVRPYLADLRRTTSPETPFSGLSHPIWSARAILSAVSHLT
jgi:hypothetical protein